MYLKGKNIKFLRPVRIFKALKATKCYYSPLTLNYYIFLISFIRCKMKGGFSASEVFQLGFGSTFPSSKDISRYISSSKMMEIDRTLNPASWFPTTYNKGIFYKICKNLNLPIPKLYAIIFKNTDSISYINSSFIKKDNLTKLIRDELPNEFVIKPELGTLGEFINIYTKTSDGIIDGKGNIRSEREIIENVFSVKRYQSFVVQERLKNHNEILQISHSEFLHTLRIITLLDLSGQCKILHAHLNIATEQSIASQLSDLKISISLNDGSLEYGIYIDKESGGFKKVTEHPETGQKFGEFKIPQWDEVLELAEEAAVKFFPLRTLGWDIAIAENGLSILETNNYPYTPPNFFKPMDKFIKTLLIS